MSGSNGTNGHSKSGIDLGADRDTREPKPCLARLDNGGWCQLVDGHHAVMSDGRKIATPCEGPARPFGPEQSQWHVHRGQKRMCGAVTGPATLCGFERGHGGKHEEPKP